MPLSHVSLPNFSRAAWVRSPRRGVVALAVTCLGVSALVGVADPSTASAATRAGATRPGVTRLSGVPSTPEVWTPPSQVDRSPVGNPDPSGTWTSAAPATAPAVELAGARPPVRRAAPERALRVGYGSVFGSVVGSDGGVTPSDDAVAAPGLGVQGFYQFQDVPFTEAVDRGEPGQREPRRAGHGPDDDGPGDRDEPRAVLQRAVLPGGRVRAEVVDLGRGRVGLEVGTGTGTGGNGIATGTVVFRAPSGFRAKFTAVGPSTMMFTAPSGLNADLVRRTPTAPTR